MNLADMSIEQLEQLQDQLNREIKQRRARDKKELLSKIKELAVAGGYTLEELLSGAVNPPDVSRTVRVVAAKYRHPQQPELTWTGRGRQPRWVASLMAEGKSLTDLLIR